MWLLIVLAVGLLLPAIPVELAFVYDSEREARRMARLRWAFGLVRIRLRARSAAGERPARPRRRGWPGRRARAALRSPGLAPTVARRLARIVGAVRVRDLEARAHIGTGDPADTGALFGVMMGVLNSLPAPAVLRQGITVIPDFEQERAELRLRGSLRVIPGVVLGHLLVLVLSPAVRHGLVRMARA